MLKKVILALLVLLPLAVSGPAQAEPFGATAGAGLRAFSEIREAGLPHRYHYMVIPSRPHPAFAEYVAFIPPGYGLLSLSGLTGPIADTPDGKAARQAFDRIREELTREYGTCEQHDHLAPGSGPALPEEWTRSIIQRKRIYGAIWTRKSGARLPEDLFSVYLAVIPYEGQTAVSVMYQFTRYDEYMRTHR